MGDLLDLGEAPASELLQAPDQGADVLVGEAVVDERAFAARLDEPGLAERPQVRAGVLDRGGTLVGQQLDGLLPLTQQVQELDPLWTPEGVPDTRELAVEGVLEFPM